MQLESHGGNVDKGFGAIVCFLILSKNEELVVFFLIGDFLQAKTACKTGKMADSFPMESLVAIAAGAKSPQDLLLWIAPQ